MKKYQVGDIVGVIGHGLMLVEEQGNIGESYRLRSHGNYSYWAKEEHLYKKADKKDLEDEREAHATRGLECKDPNCWCIESNE